MCVSVCFVGPIITQEPQDQFASNFDRETRETHGSWRVDLKAKITWAALGSQSSIFF